MPPFSNLAPKAVLSKIEPEKGTAVPLTATEFDGKVLNASRIAYAYNSARSGDIANGSHKKSTYVHGINTATATLDLEMLASNTNLTAPSWYKYMYSAGFQDYDDLGETASEKSLKYDGLINCKSLTYAVIYYETCGITPKGYKESIRGAVNNITISGETGKVILLKNSLSGVGVDPVAVLSGAPITPTIAETTNKPTVMMGGTFTINGVTRRIKSFELAMNAQVEFLQDASSVEGVLYAYIGTLDPTINLTLESVEIATQDVHADIKSDTIYSSIVLNFGKWKIQVDNPQPYDRKDGAIDSLLGDTISLTAPTITIVQKA